MPYFLANTLQKYLSALDQFKDLSIAEKPQSHSYVSPASATWNEVTSAFNLNVISKGALMQYFDINEKDGRFYIGLVVYLERGPNHASKTAILVFVERPLDWSGSFSATRTKNTREFVVFDKGLWLRPF